MRRVAGELRAGTMTLYHYVRNKDELMSLIDDAIMGELLIPDGELPDNWRDALAAIARRTRDALLRHPWTVEIPPLTEGGPNGTRHFEQTLVAVAGTGLEPVERVEVAALIDDYVFGFAMRRNQFVATAGGDPAEIADRWADHARAPRGARYGRVSERRRDVRRPRPRGGVRRADRSYARAGAIRARPRAAARRHRAADRARRLAQCEAAWATRPPAAAQRTRDSLTMNQRCGPPPGTSVSPTTRNPCRA